MDIVSSNTNTAEQTTEIYIKKILPGSIENVRLQLIGAIESLGYDIIEDEPHIVARRGAKSWGTWYGSADVLDYAATLTVRLKSVGANSTRATFDYLIKHPMLNTGEKNVLVQEAKTIAAISKRQAIEKMCSVCETESTDDSKFCRKCGAPLTSEQAELEVLRLMAEARAGKTSVVASSLSMIISTILVVVAFILNNAELLKPKAFVLFLSLGGLGILFAIMSSFFGWNRLKRALEKTEIQPRQMPRHASESFNTGEFPKMLPSQQAPASITEGTTNLLDEELINRREREKIPVSNRRNTNNLD
ncbi:MAG: zinc ribbon domain-containing protein [Acidobacteriota bacterium]|nr:zinc ribbon domain-containing protein [Acidobacteriota bacterium]